jgi:hypothetical protein
MGHEPRIRRRKEAIVAQLKQPLHLGVATLSALYVTMRVALLYSCTSFLVWIRSPVFDHQEIVNFVFVGLALAFDLAFTVVAARVLLLEEKHLLVLVRSLCLYGAALTVTFFSYYLPELAKLAVLPFYLGTEAIRIAGLPNSGHKRIFLPELLFALLVAALIVVVCLEPPLYLPIVLLLLMYLGLALKVVLMALRWRFVEDEAPQHTSAH